MKVKDKMIRSALSNNADFHLVAWIQKGKQIIFSTNSLKENPHFKRVMPDSAILYSAHAEMAVLLKLSHMKHSAKGLDLFVVRFTKRGERAVSKPCKYCMKHIREAGIRKVHYIDWDGELKTIKV